MTTENETKFEKLGEYTQELMQKTGMPGIALGILYEGQIYTAGFGMTNVDNPLPVTDKTLYQIGSITKTFTGMAIMRLVEMGKIDLDATVRTYIPDFKVADEEASAKATVRHLLTHTSGWIGDFFHGTGRNNDALAQYVNDMADLEQLLPIDTTWSYNNAGFSVAGYIIEKVTGKSYEEALKELVLEPLGMKHSFFEPGDVIADRFAVGHETGAEGVKVASPWELPRATRPAGGIICDVHELLRYAKFQMGDGTTEDGTRLLKPETISAMHTSQVKIIDDLSIGLSWKVEEIDGVHTFSHSGGTVGQITQLFIIPEHDFAFVLFTNSDVGGLIMKELTHWVFKEYTGKDSPRPAPIEASAEELAEYAGFYYGSIQDLYMKMIGGRLILQVIVKAGFPSEETPIPASPPPMTLGKCAEDRLIVLDGMMRGLPIDVIRNAEGEIIALRGEARVHIRREK